jgi:hypothetical protein
VIDDNDVDLLQREELLEFCQKRLGERGLYRVDQGGLDAAADQIGIVGGTVVGREEVVEHFQFGVFGPDPMDSGCDFNNFGHCLDYPFCGWLFDLICG